MHVSEFPDAGPSRDQAILERVSAGTIDFEFSYVESTHNGNTAKFKVFRDALKIDNVRVNVNAKTQQAIADILSCSMITAKISDLIFDQAAVRVDPCTAPISSTTKAMIDHSAKVDGKIGTVTGKPLIATVGKDWVLDAKLAAPKMANQAINYGWHVSSYSYKDGGNYWAGIKVNTNSSLIKDPSGKYWCGIQIGPGTAHDAYHSDYSQICRLVFSKCLVNGLERDFVELLKNPELAPLASHTGALSVTRQS